MRTWSIIAVLSGALFLMLALAVRFAPDVVGNVDAIAAEWVLPFQTHSGISLFLAITALGSGIGVIVVAIGFAYIARLSTAHVLRLTILLGAVLFTSRLLKDFFAQERPDPLHWFDTLASFSFPSAHATAVLALYGFIAVYLYRRTRKFLYVFLPALVVLFVGLSRVVLNAHHLSDVVGGYLLALTLLGGAFMFPFSRFTK